jgi:predicted alpha/beta superfamily hydrolase
MLKPFDLPISAVLPNTEIFEIDSKISGGTYVIWVTTPPGYDAAGVGRYPAIFVPDGNLAAPALIPNVQALSTLELIHPIVPFIQVAVGYRPADVATSGDFLAIRARDLIPAGEPLPPGTSEASFQAIVDAGMMSAGSAQAYLHNLRNPRADLFLAFLADELHPLISARWRVDVARSGFFGFSYGGLFAAWLALQAHPLFPKVCAGSPGIIVPDSKVYELLAEARQSGTDHSGRHLHLTICDLELQRPTFYQPMAAQWSRLLAELGMAPLNGLTVSSHIVPHETHLTGYVASWSSFLRTCYSASAAAR